MPTVEREVGDANVKGVAAPLIKLDLKSTETFNWRQFDAHMERFSNYWGAKGLFRFVVADDFMYITPVSTVATISERLDDRTLAESIEITDRLQCAGRIQFESSSFSGRGVERAMSFGSFALSEAGLLSLEESLEYATEIKKALSGFFQF
jgi:hypothetical protein